MRLSPADNPLVLDYDLIHTENLKIVRWVQASAVWPETEEKCFWLPQRKVVIERVIAR